MLTVCRRVVEGPSGPGHNCGWLTGKSEVGFHAATTNSETNIRLLSVRVSVLMLHLDSTIF